MAIGINTFAELAKLKLYSQFGSSVSEIKLERNVETLTPVLIVRFANGHTVRNDSTDIDDPNFLAQCAMVYDL